MGNEHLFSKKRISDDIIGAMLNGVDYVDVVGNLCGAGIHHYYHYSTLLIVTLCVLLYTFSAKIHSIKV